MLPLSKSPQRLCQAQTGAGFSSVIHYKVVFEVCYEPDRLKCL